MSGLSSDQIVDYLIIGLITSIFAGLVDLFLKRNDIKGNTRAAAVTGLIVVAVGIGYWRLRERSKEEASIRGGGGTSQGTSGSNAGTPPMTRSQTPTQTPASTPTRESYIDSFVRENIA